MDKKFTEQERAYWARTSIPPEYASDIERDALVEQALEDATPDELAGQLLEKLRKGDQISRPARKWLWAELLDANVGEF